MKRNLIVKIALESIPDMKTKSSIGDIRASSHSGVRRRAHAFSGLSLCTAGAPSELASRPLDASMLLEAFGLPCARVIIPVHGLTVSIL